MNIKFEKMHALGNDFVLIDCFESSISNPWKVAEKYLDRHFGIGGDQLLLLLPSSTADVKMRIFNPDGSEAEMCGNGIRCLVDFALRKGRIKGDVIKVETLAGIKKVEKKGELYSVNMGAPSLEPDSLPSTVKGKNPVKINIENKELEVFQISMGNPHIVTFETVPFEIFGSKISENRTYFPRGTNVEFVSIKGENSINVKVWERGAGPTLACGTGACASAVASIISGRVKSPVDVNLPGGDLLVEWEEGGEVILTGPATKVFEGIVENLVD